MSLGRQGHVIAIDRSSGDRRWLEETDSFSPAGPALHGPTAVVPGDRVFGFDVTSGDHRWSSASSFTMPVAIQDGQSLYVGSAWNLAKVDLTDGSQVWAWGHRERGHAPSTNLVLDPLRGYLYGTDNWQFFAVDVQTGDVAWEGEYDAIVRSFYRKEDTLLSTAEIDAGNTKLVALDLSEPAVSWEKIAPLDVDGWEYGRVTTGLADPAGRAVAGTSTGHLVTLDPGTGDLVDTARIFEDEVRRLHTHGDRALVTSQDALCGVDLTEI